MQTKRECHMDRADMGWFFQKPGNIRDCEHQKLGWEAQNWFSPVLSEGTSPAETLTLGLQSWETARFWA